MKSLAERHADRAQRKVDNATESTAGNVRGVIGHAASAVIAANEAIGKLTDAERAELETALEVRGFNGFEPIGDAELADLAGNGGNGWGALPPSDGPKPVNVSMKVADIEAIAEAEGVDLSTASNNQDRVDLIEKARAEA